MSHTTSPPEVSSLDARQQFDEQFVLVYGELRRLANAMSRGDAAATPTLTPTDLVNQAWEKLAATPSLAATSRIHFKRIAARAMRQVLVDVSRRRSARKRPGGAAFVLVPFDEEADDRIAVAEDVLAVDTALKDLQRRNPRQAAVVEGKFFGGLEVKELAESLDVSESTVRNDWRLARAWLRSQLRKT